MKIVDEKGIIKFVSVKSKEGQRELQRRGLIDDPKKKPEANSKEKK